MKSGKPDGDDTYVVAITTQLDTPVGVSTWNRIGFATGPDKPFHSTQSAVEWLRHQTEMDSVDYRVVSHYVGPANPFDSPTRCLVSATLMPAGHGFAARLRQYRREYLISNEFNLVHAFTEMLAVEVTDSIIGWSVSPVDLPL